MHRSTRFLVTWAALMLLFAVISTSSAQTFKLGVFDPQRVSEETIEGKRIQAMLGEARETRQQELNDETTRVNELQQQLEQQALSLSNEKRTEMEIDIQRRLLELNSRKDVATRAFQLEIAAAEAQFNEKLRAVVNQFAQNEEFSVILESGAVAYANSSIDVTTAVIDLFNRMYPGKTE